MVSPPWGIDGGASGPCTGHPEELFDPMGGDRRKYSILYGQLKGRTIAPGPADRLSVDPKSLSLR